MTIYYVAPSGSNGAAGTSGAPWRDIAYAVGQAAAGDTIRVRTGTYYESFIVSKNNVTVEADSGHTPTVDGRYSAALFGAAGYTTATGAQIGPNQLPYPSTANANRGNWVIAGAMTFLIRLTATGATLRGFTIRNICGRAVGMSGASTVLEDCVIDFTYGGPVRMDGAGARMSNCKITRGSIKYYDPTRDGAGPARVQTSVIIGSNGAIVEDCVVAYCYGEGVSADKGSRNVIVRRCTIHTNSHWSLGINGSANPIFHSNVLYWCNNLASEMDKNDTPALITIGDEQREIYKSTGGTFYNNLVIGGGTTFLISQGTSGRPWTMYRGYMGYNTLIGGPPTDRSVLFIGVYPAEPHSQSIVENNIILRHPSGPGPAGVLQSGLPASGITFRNNLSNEALPGHMAGTNSIVTTSPVLVNAFATITGVYNHKSTALPDPLNTTFNANNYKLTGTSQAIGRASNRSTANSLTPPTITTDRAGATRTDLNAGAGRYYDIGQHEYGGVSDPGSVTANFTQSGTGGEEPYSVTLTNTSTATSPAVINSYEWSSGDGQTATGPGPVTFVYNTAGVYTPSLVVRDTVRDLQSTKVGAAITVTTTPPPAAGSDVLLAQTRVALNTSDGEQTITAAALGSAVPKRAIFRLTRATADGAAADGELFSYGVAVGTTEVVVAIAADHGTSGTVCGQRRATNAVALVIDGSGAVVMRASLVGWVAGGVKIAIDWTGAAAAYLMTVEFGAGPDYSAWCGAVALGVNGSSTVINQAGFAPHVGRFASVWAPVDTADENATLSLGLAHKDGPQYCLERQHPNGKATSGINSRLLDTQVLLRRNGAGLRAAVIAENWSGQGLTLRVADADVSESALVLLEAFGASRSRVALVTAPTATGNQDYALPWDPQYVTHLVSPRTALGGINSSAEAGTLGVHSATAAAEYTDTVSGENGVATTNEQSLSDNRVAVPSHNGTLLAAGTTTLGTGKYTVNYATVPGTALLWPSLAVEVGTATGDEDILAEFQGTPQGGNAPLAVAFVDLSGGPVTSWLWEFGDGETSTEQNPTHVYAADGTYTVSLTVSDGTSTDTETKAGYIVAATRGLRRIIVGPLRILPVTEASTTVTRWDADNPDPNRGTIEVGQENSHLRLSSDAPEPGARADEISIFFRDGALKVKLPDGTVKTLTWS